LSAYDAAILTSRRDLGDYYEAAVAAHDNPKSIANWVMGDVQRIVRDRRLDDALVIEEWPVAATKLGNLVMRIDDQTISGKIAKTVFEQMLESGKDADQIIEEQGLRQVTDLSAIAAVVTSVIAAHPDKVEEYRGGKDKLIGFFVGLVMKETQGKANPKAVNEALRAQLAAPE
jgi:aspartyl-tRNA(Asn)/glutamyl-tRNA(Gln) amidotransferase subunit B